MSRPQPPQPPRLPRNRRASLYRPAPGYGVPGPPYRPGAQGPGATMRRPPSRFRRFAPWIAGALAVLISGFLGYTFWTLRDLPDPGSLPVLARSIVVYDRKGRQIEQRNSRGEYYRIVALKDMGRWGPAATLAAEDRDFYHHGAIDYGATARAAFQDVTHHGYAQGGSTITQQLVKIQVLSPQKSVFRKAQEALLATAVEQRYSKDQILEMYMNRVFYGHNAYGLGAATQVYFGAGKQPKDLTAGQAAFLAALINGPTYYDPQLHYDRAKARQQYVLDGMVKTGALSRAEADQAALEDIRSELKFDQSLSRSLAPHFVNYVVSKLEERFGADLVQHGGFAVQTTLDLDLQALAERSVTDGVNRLKRTGVNNGDLLAARPDTGEILAWVGSADPYDQSIAGPFDVIQSPRQPGSSFKPYVYEAALKDRKITLATTLHDRPTDFGNYRPRDFDDRFMGDMSARRSLLLSRNVPAVETAQIEGIDNVIKTAQSMGIKTELKPVLSTAIGGSEVTMLEHLQGYQTLANQGIRVPLMAITRITDAQGANTLYLQEPGRQDGISKPLSPAEAYLITDTLKDYNQQWGLGWRRPMAGKSGTTGGNTAGVHPDAWMMAYSPDIVVGAWAGNTAPNGGGKPVAAFGTDVGQQILGQFINGLPDNMRNWYRQPDGITTGSGCSGDRSSGGRELFLTGTDRGVNCPASTPTPTATPTPAPTETPTPSPPPGPSISPAPPRTPTPSPRASPS